MYDAYAPPSAGAVHLPADPAMQTDPPSAVFSSPSRRQSVASTASLSPYAAGRGEGTPYNSEGPRSYGAALASFPDRVPIHPHRSTASAAYADDSSQRYRDQEYTAPYDAQGTPYSSSKAQTRGTGAAALLQQHAANQWAFRANQTTLPTPPHLAQPQTTTEPQYGRRNSLHQSATASYSSQPLSQSLPQASTYVPYGYSRPSPASREHSSSGSSTSASTPAAAPLTGKAMTSMNGGSGSSSSKTRSTSGAEPPSGDFAQSFYDPFRIKHRRRTSPAQLRVLEHHFTRSPKPDLTLRKQLATELDMTPREVQVWFQNRRAKVKKLQERAARAAGSPAESSSQRDTSYVQHDMADDYNGDDGQIGGYESRSRDRTVSASQPGPHGYRNGSVSMADDDYAQPQHPLPLTLPDPSGAVPYPTPTSVEAYAYPPLPKPEPTDLPLPPPPAADYFNHATSSSGRRYSLPAFASSVIPPTPFEEYGVNSTGPAGGAHAAIDQTSLPPPPTTHAYGRRPSLFSLAPTPGSSRLQPGEYSPSGSASSRGSDIKPASIPEHAVVSSWDNEMKPASAEDSPVPYQQGVPVSLASRRASAPPLAPSHLQLGDGYIPYSTASPTSRPLSTPAWTAPSADATGYAVNTAVYPAPGTLIDPVSSVSYVQSAPQEVLYDYQYPPYSTSTSTVPVSEPLAPLEQGYVSVSDLDRPLL
ncbi:hypothetical protein JCM10908_002077 [Rhodotorula pacifica]|uniref:uncharacterized protein n=1 Tax=Rhodotorula pacifica TaxID=1495444 RepID=UPI0031777599